MVQSQHALVPGLELVVVQDVAGEVLGREVRGVDLQHRLADRQQATAVGTGQGQPADVGLVAVLLRPDVRRPLLVDGRDRKSTRLNSSHVKISYAVFCLKKKNR